MLSPDAKPATPAKTSDWLTEARPGVNDRATDEAVRAGSVVPERSLVQAATCQGQDLCVADAAHLPRVHGTSWTIVLL